MTGIVGRFEIVLAVRIALPPNVTTEQAITMLSNNGINMPLGLLQFIRQVHTEVVEPNAPATIPPLEDGGRVLRMQ